MTGNVYFITQLTPSTNTYTRKEKHEKFDFIYVDDGWTSKTMLLI